ncbi:MAG: phosphoglucosamine mutase [Candidatus ainarchaeum sp.]|nr:phosphoglucosamine mutase [Candidatus ainarchaeum sp.]
MLFGTSGIRDHYGTKITPQLAMGIANAFASFNEDVAVASDLRETSELLRHAAMSGIVSRGANAIDLGCVPTPTLALFTQTRKIRGIMITASHNPSEYNGLKLYKNGREISKNEEEAVEKKYEKGMELAKWDEVGKVKKCGNAICEHIELVKKSVDSGAIKRAKIKVVLDCNGVGSVITPRLLSELGCTVISMNSAGLGFYRPSEPNAENLSELGKMVRGCNAQLGIGHDGDADRAIILDENGEMLGLDVQFAIAIEHELMHRKGIVVNTVEASLLVKETIEKNGGKSVQVAVGSTNVSEEMEGKGAVFGGEPAGEYIFKGGVNTPDGMMVAAKFLEIFAEQGSLAKLRKKYKTYPILREKFKCTDRKKAMEKIMKILSLGGKRNTIDGLREDFHDGFVLVRPSGTEHIIRLTAEFLEGKRLEEMAGKAREAIKGAIGS